MTEAQRDLLRMCQPEVTLQALAPLGRGRVKSNPHFVAAEQCAANGWLVHVRDKDFGKSVYRITPAGADALAKQH